MTDATRLTYLLDGYANALAGHLGLVQEEFVQLERAWLALSDVYEGRGANQFRDVFDGAARRMRDYEAGATGMLTLLRERIESLRRFDGPQGDL